MIKGNEIEEQWQKTEKKLEKTTEITIKKTIKKHKVWSPKSEKMSYVKENYPRNQEYDIETSPLSLAVVGEGKGRDVKQLLSLKCQKIIKKKKAWES